MTQTRFMFWLWQLCEATVLDLNQLGDEQASLLLSLDELGLDYRIDERMLTLETKVDLLDIDAVRQSLSRPGAAIECLYQLVTGSTNLDVLGYFKKHQQCSVAVCETQTGGKGRRGNRWVSPFAKNIYCTVGILKPIDPAHLGLLSIVTGLALCRALANLGYRDVKLKWPNDLYHQQKKLGGILIESQPVEAGQYFLAIGFGINVDMSVDEISRIEQAATSLNLTGANRVSRSQILIETMNQLQADIKAFDEDKITQLVADFNENDALRGMPVSVLASGQTIVARNAGIAPDGQLQVETEHGMRLFCAADISLRQA